MCTMIDQFSWPYFTVWPAKFISLLEFKYSPSILTERYNKYLINLILRVCAISYATSFFPFWSMDSAFHTWAINPGGETWSVT